MALYIPQSIFHLARLLYVRPETFGPYYVIRQIRSREVVFGIGPAQARVRFNPSVMLRRVTCR